jgi:hypothetical protein
MEGSTIRVIVSVEVDGRRYITPKEELPEEETNRSPIDLMSFDQGAKCPSRVTPTLDALLHYEVMCTLINGTIAEANR